MIAQAITFNGKIYVLNACKEGRQTILHRDRQQQCKTLTDQSG